MKIKQLLVLAMALSALPLALSTAEAQGTAFTYQGLLNTNAAPANGFFDFEFALYTNSTGTGTQVGSTITQTNIGVTNGLFSTALDFGPVFTGNETWLAMSVRSNGVGSYTALKPLQELNPTPYAITAENLDGTLSASQLSGTLPADLLSGTYGGTLSISNSGDSFSGNGAGLVNVNALTLGGFGPGGFWNTLGNAGTTPGVNFLGTTDNEPLSLEADGSRGFQIQYASTFSVLAGSTYSMNVIGGYSGNTTSNNAIGVTIAGGGYSFYRLGIPTPITGSAPNVVTGSFGTVGGGYGNTAGAESTVPGGYENVATGTGSFAAGQYAQALDDGSFVWADASSASAFATTADNQFLIRSSFVGINRTSSIEGDDWFDIHAPVTNNWGGMYMETAGLGKPFYGYAMDGVDYAWTWLNGSTGGDNSWNVYDQGGTLTLTPSGQLGVNTSPTQALEVKGNWALIDGANANNGSGPIDAYIGGNGSGSDVQVGSLNSNIANVAFYNWGNNTYMHIGCSSITINGGSDLAEPFAVSSPSGEIPEGSVVVIDEENPGRLKVSSQAYDTRVAGVLSGANGIHPGIQMQQQALLEGGRNVALTGRVYVQADSSNGAIKPGDLLTTSSCLGRAMKVSDHLRAQGAILGKAMSGLSQDKGMVLVLVTLQ